MSEVSLYRVFLMSEVPLYRVFLMSEVPLYRPSWDGTRCSTGAWFALGKPSDSLITSCHASYKPHVSRTKSNRHRKSSTEGNNCPTEGVSFHRIKPPVGVVTGCQSPDVTFHLPRWCEVVVLRIEKPAFPLCEVSYERGTPVQAELGRDALQHRSLATSSHLEKQVNPTTQSTLHASGSSPDSGEQPRGDGGSAFFYERRVSVSYRGTSLTRNSPSP